jgi:hypothetical protein
MTRISKKRKLAKLTKFLLGSIAVILIYSVLEFYYAIKTGMTHDTLTTCMFAFFGTELASCTLVKIFNIIKDKGEKNDNDSNINDI